MGSRFVYFAGDRLSSAELSAACLDGHLVGLGDAYVPADIVETKALRAASLDELLAETLAATHQSAAWVLGVIDEPPPRHFVQRAVAHRIHHVVDRRLVYRDPRIDPDDVIIVGGVRVSSPPRTLADLARTSAPDSRLLAARWARDDPAVADAALAWFDRHRSLPHKREASRLLRAAQDDVTR